MKRLIAAALLCFALPHAAAQAPFATPDGPEPANIEAIGAFLDRSTHDLELFISFGTSKGGSAGHLALAIRDAAPGGDDLVYSANFYADRDPAHEAHHYTRELMVRIPRLEYLYRTRSTLDPKASFGLDFGEAYKRSLVGIRVSGVPQSEKEALATYFARMNGDFATRARDTEYHGGEVRYDYMRLNCAKTIGSAFRYGAGYDRIEISAPLLFPGMIAAALHANVPTGMALQLVEEWNRRGYGMDVVLYRKYGDSAWIDPLEEEKVAFRDLPNRFPSVISRDFRRDAGEYRDYDNLYAMYLFNNLLRYAVGVNGDAQRLEVIEARIPMPFDKAAETARRDASEDSAGFLRGGSGFRPRGQRIGAKP